MNKLRLDNTELLVLMLKMIMMTMVTPFICLRLTLELKSQLDSIIADKAEVGCLKAVILFNPESENLAEDLKLEIERRRDQVNPSFSSKTQHFSREIMIEL